MFISRFLTAALVVGSSRCSASTAPSQHRVTPSKNTCVVKAGGDAEVDDGPAILDAFDKCKSDSRIVFQDTTYHINSPLNTTELSNVDIDIHGYLLWSNDTEYWLDHSMPIGYQNQSTVWFLGGDNLNVNGHGTGTFDGNGQAWYDFVKGQSNYPNRPMALTIYEATNSVFRNLNFVQSQMWSVTVMHSSHLLMEDIYVNNTSTNENSDINTDGIDTLYADDITLRRWTVENGDDAITPKANSTNILVEDCVFYRGSGFALGSIGQYPGQFEIIENVTVRNLTTIGTNFAIYVKTWTGDQVGYPPNGGGGGVGYIRNITIEDVSLTNVRSNAFNIGQCTNFEGADGDCDSSEFEVGDMVLRGFKGSLRDNDVVAQMECSASAPPGGGCHDITLEDWDIVNAETGEQAEVYNCDDVVSWEGFECTKI